MAKVIKLPVPSVAPPEADEPAERKRADDQRKRRLFAWANDLLKRLGFNKRVAVAKSVEDLHHIVIEDDDADVILEIRDALHPVSGGQREAHFVGLEKGGLIAILRNRLREMKKAREAILLRGSQANWSEKLILDKKGKPVPNLANLILILREHPQWKGVLGFNEFAMQVTIRKTPPWGVEDPDAAWSDHRESQARVWFQDRGINPGVGDTGRSVQAAARSNAYHPARDYFNSLTWNGTPQLPTWLVRFFGADDIPFIRAIGPRFLISAVARVFEPGCKVDHMPVLEGPQGWRKSEGLRTLVPDEAWFTDRLSNIGGKDAMLEIAGVLLAEISEMEALIKAKPTIQKGFISRRFDRFRPPYAKHVIRVPRSCVFAGTINPPPNNRYLRDQTGNRRFWTFTCRGEIDLDGLRQARDALWAEAVHLFKAGHVWHLETKELERSAGIEQEKRRVVDAWEEAVREWVGSRTDVDLSEVFKHALELPKKHHTPFAQSRVVAILRQMGFVKRRPRIRGERKRLYQRDQKVDEN
jgi:predicted P-loop ATPase